MAQDRNNDSEELRNLIIEQFCRSEKRAAETGQTIVGEIRLGPDQRAESFLLLCYICEPGKPAQVLTADAPMNRYALALGDVQSFGRLH
jgi:hypothetical protein